MPSDYGVRQGLVNKGYSNDDVGYDQNSGYVTVKGQNFLKPDLNVAGTTYTNQQSFDNAFNQFQKQQQGQPLQTHIAQTQPTTQQPTTQYKNPYADQYTQMIGQIQQMMSQPAADPYSTPQYAAAQAHAQRGAQQGIRSAQEAFGSSGFGRSTALGNAAQREQNNANEYLMTQVVPSIVNQLQNQRQQEMQNQMSLLNPVMSLLGREDNLAQQGRENSRADAALTGQYLPADAQKVINQILGLKQQAETGALDPQSARIEADRYRSQLAGMGVNPDIVGYESDYNQALQNVAKGNPTMAKQQQDFAQQKDQRDFDYTVVRDEVTDTRNQRIDDLSETQVMAQLTGYLPDGTPTNAQQQQQLQNAWMEAQQMGKVTPTLSQLTGIPEGTPTMAAANQAFNQSMQRSQLGNQVSQQAVSNQLAREKFEFDKEQTAAKPSTIKVDAKESADNYDMIFEDLQSPNVSKETARELVEANRDFLSDSDYKKLRDYINDNY